MFGLVGIDDKIIMFFGLRSPYSEGLYVCFSMRVFVQGDQISPWMLLVYKVIGILDEFQQSFLLD